MKQTLIILLSMCLGVVWGEKYAMRTTWDSIFGEATVEEIKLAGRIWK